MEEIARGRKTPRNDIFNNFSTISEPNPEIWYVDQIVLMWYIFGYKTRYFKLDSLFAPQNEWEANDGRKAFICLSGE
jgi:hypothetical protein